MSGLRNLGLFLSLFILLLPVGVVCAADTGGMSQEQMQKMMNNAQKMQECFKDIDQSALARLEEDGRKVGEEIESLCQAGKRDQAQTRAMDYAAKMRKTKEFRAIKKCGMMGMENMPMFMPKSAENSGHGHVCDHMD